MALGARDSPGAREVSAHDATLTDEVQKLVYWINSLPGKRCLLASKPKHLRDGECICELTAMLLGAAAAGGRPPSKTSPLKKQSDVDRLERALDRLCTDAGLRLSGVGAGDARSRVLLTISKTAARIARGDPETTLHVLNFLRTALKHEAAIADPSLSAGNIREDRAARATAAVVDDRSRRRESTATPTAGGPEPRKTSRPPESPSRRALEALETLSGAARARSPSAAAAADAAAAAAAPPPPPTPPSASKRLGDLARSVNGEEDDDDSASLSEWKRRRAAPRKSRVEREREEEEATLESQTTRARDPRSSSSSSAAALAAASVAAARAKRAEASEQRPWSYSRTTYAYHHQPSPTKKGEGHGGAPSPPPRVAPPVGRPSWTGPSQTRASVAAPLSKEQRDVLLWLLKLGLDVPGAKTTRGGDVVRLPSATELEKETSKGLLLCDLVSLLEGVFLGTLIARPKHKKESMHNVNKALAVLRRGGKMPSTFLWSTTDVAAADPRAVWGLLRDAKTTYGGSKPGRRKIRISDPGGSTPRRVVNDANAPFASPTRRTSKSPGRSKSASKSGFLHTTQQVRSAERNLRRELDMERELAELRGHFEGLGGAGSTTASGAWRRATPRNASNVSTPVREAAAKVAAKRAAAKKTTGPSRAAFAFDADAAGARAHAARSRSSSSAPRRASMPSRRPVSRPPRCPSADASAARRPPFVNSGYVSPNARRVLSPPRSRSRSRSASAPRARANLFGGRYDAAEGSGDHSRSSSPGRPSSPMDTSPDGAPRRASKPAEPRRSVAETRAAAAAAAGNVPVVFEYNPGPPPPQPGVQQRDDEVREWLKSLRLGVTPREEAAELLANPLRNGVLLSDVMTVLVGAPPLGRRERRPRTLTAARANVERALVPLRTMPDAIPPSLTWSTEGTLKGMRENIFGLLWHVKHAVPEQASFARAPTTKLKASRRSAPSSRGASAPASPRTSTGNAHGATVITPGTTIDPAAVLEGFVDDAVVTGPASPIGPSARAGTGSDWPAAEPDLAKTSTRVYQYVPIPAKAAKKRTKRPSEPPTAFNAVDPRAGRAVSGYEALPYSDPDVKRLESSITRWLHAMGLLPDGALRASFAALCPEIAKGVLLCDLVEAVEGVPVVGVTRNPKTPAVAEANVRRACERLARHRMMCRRFLFNHADVAAGIPGITLGLLEDVRAFYDGLPPRTATPTCEHWTEMTPYAPSEPRAAPSGEAPEMQFGGHGVGAGATASPPPSPGRVLRRMAEAERSGAREEERWNPADPGDPGDVDDDGDEIASTGSVDFASRAAMSPPNGATTTSSSDVFGWKARRENEDDDGADVGSATRDASAAQDEALRNLFGDTEDEVDEGETPPARPTRMNAAIDTAARKAAEAATRLDAGDEEEVDDNDELDAPRYSPSIPTRPTRIGAVGREDVWQSESFPRRRASAAEVDRNREAVSARKAAAEAEAVRKSYTEAAAAEREAAAAAAAAAAAEAEAARGADAMKPPVSRASRKKPGPGDGASTRPATPASVSSGGFVATSATAARAAFRARSASPARRREDETHGRPPFSVAASADWGPFSSAAKRRLASSASSSGSRAGGAGGGRTPSSSFDPVRRRLATPSTAPPPRESAGRVKVSGWSDLDVEAARIARWIDSLGVSLRRKGTALAALAPTESALEALSGSPSPAAELAEACGDGTLLCELVSELEHEAIKGVTWDPKARASELHNVKKALAKLRDQPAMSPMHLYCEKEIVARDASVAVGLLGDVKACVAYQRRVQRTPRSR